MQRGASTTMTRNRVRHWADQKGWTSAEIYRQAIIKNIKIGQSTIDRLYAEPSYMASISSLEALARVLGLQVTDLIEDVPEQSNKTQ
jgi:Cro/C1-type HTH DNA-binding domain